jgi:hypothetical protein
LDNSERFHSDIFAINCFSGIFATATLSVLFDREAILKYKPPNIILFQSGSENFSVPAVLWKAPHFD